MSFDCKDQVAELHVFRGSQTRCIAWGYPIPPPGSCGRRDRSSREFLHLFFDDVHLEFANLVQVRDAEWKHLSSTRKPAHRGAVYTTSAQTMLKFIRQKKLFCRITNF
jgi:hypothetical protein